MRVNYTKRVHRFNYPPAYCPLNYYDFINNIVMVYLLTPSLEAPLPSLPLLLIEEEERDNLTV